MNKAFAVTDEANGKKGKRNEKRNIEAGRFSNRYPSESKI